MINAQNIIKSTGEEVAFDKLKLEKSLINSGALDSDVASIIQEILPWLYKGITTRELYAKAFKLLRKIKRCNAARYSLKRAIMELGPSGFPFEQYVGYILKSQGFDVEVGVIVQGYCIRHEVDVVATLGKKQYLVECKYYNDQGKYASVQVPLYIHSRVNDVIRKRTAMPEFKDINFEGWIVTNTRFTADASDYGNCSGLTLISWDYPSGRSLKDMIDKNSIYPITVLTSIEKINKHELLKRGFISCKQIAEYPKILSEIGINGNKIRTILEEVNDLCI